MPYQFATEDRDYSDLASGRVLYNLPGAPAFPVRLASEIFQRALKRIQPAQPLALYDPVCGGAYHLAVLGFLHGEKIARITASDVDESSAALARRNLSLLTPAGLDEREREIRRMLAEFSKPSHAEALESIQQLRQMERNIPSQVFVANALERDALRLVPEGSVDLVISDVPYGQRSAWHVPQPAAGMQPVTRLLDALQPLLAPGALVAIAADKAQKIAHPAYRRVERFQVGKRQVAFLQPDPPTDR